MPTQRLVKTLIRHPSRGDAVPLYENHYCLQALSFKRESFAEAAAQAPNFADRAEGAEDAQGESFPARPSAHAACFA